MKNKILGILALMFLGIYASGQQPADNERLQAMRVAFITNALQLTPEESQDFWPVYNEYETEQKEIRRKYRPGRQTMLMDDQELEQHLENTLRMEEELLQLKRTYFSRLKEVIPIRKIAMLQQAENKFKEEILKQIRQRQENRRGPLNRN
jgi:hypothetical protein